MLHTPISFFHARNQVDHLAGAVPLSVDGAERARLEGLGLRVRTAEHARVRWCSRRVHDAGNVVGPVCFDPDVGADAEPTVGGYIGPTAVGQVGRKEAPVVDGDMPNPLVGSWRLISCDSRTEAGEVSYPYGADAVGLLVYTPEGRMVGLIERAGRARFASDDPFAGSVEEKASIAETFLAYAGTYEWRGDRVLHRVEMSWFPNWRGGVPERLAELDDGRLTLRTGSRLMRGARREAALVWERIAQ